ATGADRTPAWCSREPPAPCPGRRGARDRAGARAASRTGAAACGPQSAADAAARLCDLHGRRGGRANLDRSGRYWRAPESARPRWCGDRRDANAEINLGREVEGVATLMERDAPTFEASFGGLQSTVERLEEGGLPLEMALELFERGMILAASCQRMLDQAELRL